jgi:hypothetical protein
MLRSPHKNTISPNGKTPKGINLLSYLYKTDEVSFQLGFDLIKKPIEFCDIKTKKRKLKGATSKNEMLRARLTASANATKSNIAMC